MAETKDAGATSCPGCGGMDWTYTQGDDRLRCPACEPGSRWDADAKIGAKSPSPRPLTDMDLLGLLILRAADQDGEGGNGPVKSLRAELERRGVLEPRR